MISSVDDTYLNGKLFASIALDLFLKQYEENAVYKAYVDALHILPQKVHSLTDIPFLPVSFFKTHQVVCGNTLPDFYFESSSTTGQQPSRHYIADIKLYETSLLKGFEERYGSPENYVLLALLPSYLERKNASLVYMAEWLMKKSGHPTNGFYLYEQEKLKDTLLSLEAQKQKTLLLGVTFALLDTAELYEMDLQHTIVMETGGMKGRKQEQTREEVHSFLKKRWNLKSVHAEYGMTELLSQAYSKGGGIFTPASSMKLWVRDMNDPFDIKSSGIGYLNIIDLANIHSCSFIATEDIGRLHEDGRFEVLGRMDHSALRGCSLMTA